MNGLGQATIQERACEAIEQKSYDFTAKFYAAYDLFCLARKGPESISPRVVSALKDLLLSKTYAGQRQRLFLFREAANVLATLFQLGGRHVIATLAYDALVAVLANADGQAHLAAAEALGALPLGIRGPSWHIADNDKVPTYSWPTYLDTQQIRRDLDFGVYGRSLVGRWSDKRLVVIKLARRPCDGTALQREIQWMQWLASMELPKSYAFEIPRPLWHSGAVLFRLKGLPPDKRPSGVVDSEPTAIGFIAPEDYFCYPNSSRKRPGARSFLEMMGRNAFLLGYLAGQGIVHEAPIPLFHNRVQQERRRDGGVYEWYRGGRLDQWLASCAYPNLGGSGLRDFEHFFAFKGKNLILFRQMGNHLFSLLLVCGSYFRAKAPHRMGWVEKGIPHDVRDLFDPMLFRELIESIFSHYHAGFVGRPLRMPIPVNLDRLVERMIAEMGVDRYMEEYLRVADQLQMSSDEFEGFLLARGYSVQKVAGLQKGAQDIALQTGPHLGAFNRGISLPEMVEAVAAMAAVCVAERFLNNLS